jgi:hypothetical protein
MLRCSHTDETVVEPATGQARLGELPQRFLVWILTLRQRRCRAGVDPHMFSVGRQGATP